MSKNDDLIMAVCGWTPTMDYFGGDTIIEISVFDGREEKFPNQKAMQAHIDLQMHFLPEHSSVRIVNLDSFDKRKGVGSFALGALEKLVIDINNTIKKNYKHTTIPIKYIRGMLVPSGGITEDQLIDFYEKNGYTVHNGFISKIV